MIPEGTDGIELGEALELGGDNRPVEVSLLVSWLNALGMGDLGRNSSGNRGCKGCGG